jgi:hypothetical protein
MQTPDHTRVVSDSFMINVSKSHETILIHSRRIAFCLLSL